MRLQFSNQISSFYSVTSALIYFSSLLSPITTQGAEELDLTVLIRQEPCSSSDWNRTISGPASRRRNIAYRIIYHNAL
ncbi:hypothetical protein EDD18DRAFT_1152839, partial [Armillaria luteobubalina]